MLLALLGSGSLTMGCQHAQRSLEKPDVVVIVIDTLRRDHLVEYGYDRATSAALKSFTDEATRFDDAWSLAPWTVPSTATLMTGVQPLRHHARHDGDVLPPEVLTLAERLQGAGWATGGFSHNVNVSAKLGFGQGFDTFTNYHGHVLAYPYAEEMTPVVDEWVKAHADHPFFLYLQPMNCHGPYKVPLTREFSLLGRPPSGEFEYMGNPMRAITAGHLGRRSEVSASYVASLTEQYDTAIRYQLDEVAKTIESLQRAGVYDGSLVILTADHGEELYDHGGFSHGYSLNDEVLRVPLFVKLPGQKQGKVVTDRVTLADLAPTVLDVLGVPVPEPEDPPDVPSDVAGAAAAAVPATADASVPATAPADTPPDAAPDLPDGAEVAIASRTMDTPDPDAPRIRRIDPDAPTEPVKKKGRKKRRKHAPATLSWTPPMDGRSFLPLLRDEARPDAPVLFDTDWDGRCVGKALLHGQWKLIVLDSNYEGLHDVVRLYDVASDPTETHDVASDHPEEVARLRAELDTLVAAASRSSGISTPENLLSTMNQEQLRALGYVE